jgi:L-rhamnose-H+ transport protein
VTAGLGAGGPLVLLAAVMNASFTLPMKRMAGWSWENTWLVWSIFALVMLPLAAAVGTVPGVLAGYGTVSSASLLRVVLFGAAWGVAQVLFGLSVADIGIALTFSLVLGISAAVGTVVPFVSLHPDLLLTRTGFFVWSGVALVCLGMVCCAMAGRQRERETVADLHAPTARTDVRSFRQGLLLACVSGLCASFMNLGISFASPLLSMAAAHGSLPYWRVNAVWLPLLLGGAIPNVLYCFYLFSRRRTASNFLQRGTSTYWLLAFLMAALWFGSTLLFGVANFYLGSLGPVLGWPVFMSLIVISASLLGWATGEWRTASARPFRLQLTGIALLVVAVFSFSRAGR